MSSEKEDMTIPEITPATNESFPDSHACSLAEEHCGGEAGTISNPPVADDAGASAANITNNEMTFYDFVPVEPLPFPGFIPVSFLFFPQASRIRRICLQMMLSSWFERISMAVILLNCMTLALYQPCDGICDTPGCHILAIIDHLIFAFFTLEMLIKMMAMGAVGKRTYLADSWNRLDFFIVISGLIEYLINMENMNLSAIRTIRVLRPLRAINRVPSMRILVMLLLDTLPMLGSTFLLAFFVFFSFGIVGVQLWAGLLRNRCSLSATGNITFPRGIPKYYEPQHTYLEYVCSLPKDDGMHSCENLPPYIENNRVCNGSLNDLIWMNNTASIPANTCINWHQYYTVCRPTEKNPFLGAISFDNIGTAWVAIFLVISLEGWSEIMYLVQDAHSFWVFIYFVILIVIGSFFMINLCLVVIATQFSETKKRETDRMIAERARYHSTSSLGSTAEPASCYRELVRYAGHLWRRAKRKVKAYYTEAQEKKIRDQLLKRTAHGYYGKEGFIPPERNFNEMSCERHPEQSLEGSLALIPYDYGRRMLDVQTGAHAALQSKPSYDRSSSVSFADEQNNGGRTKPSSGQISPESLAQNSQTLNSSSSISAAVGDTIPQIISASSAKESPVVPADTARRAVFNRNCDIEDTSYFWDPHEIDEIQKKPHSFMVVFSAFQARVQVFANTKLFQRGILLAILINTLSMGAEHHLQPDELATILEYLNFFFTALFCVEMLLKMVAEGLFGYLSNGYNLFDCIIVMLSLVEIVQAGGSGLSVLRTFRLLRILKLVRFMPALKRQLIIMIRTMDNVATFFALLLLFIFIFSVLGRHLFANKFCSLSTGEDCKCSDFKVPNMTLIRDRRNFDTLLSSTLTVFQILTQEDWNYVLYLAMRYTSHWAAIYFIALMTFGNYVLFNLLVAILVEGFADEEEERHSKISESPQRKIDDTEIAGQDREPVEDQGEILALTSHEQTTENAANGPLLTVPLIMRTAATPISTYDLSTTIAMEDQLLHVPQRAPAHAGSVETMQNQGIKNVSNQFPERKCSLAEEEERVERELDLAEFRAHPFRFSHRRRRQKQKISPEALYPQRRSHSLANPLDPLYFAQRQRKTSSESNGSQRTRSPASQTNGDLSVGNGSPRSVLARKSCLKPGLPMRSFSMGRVPRHRPIFRSQARTKPGDSVQPVMEQLTVIPQSLRFDSTCSIYPLSRCDSIDQQVTHVQVDTILETCDSIAQSVRVHTADNNDTESVGSFRRKCWIPEKWPRLRARYDYSYFIVPPENRFRGFCATVSDNKYFDYVILCCIGFNCITLAMERPSIPPHSVEREVLVLSNYIFTVIFAVEMALKTIAHGLIIGRHPYFSSGWNIMDGILVIISLVDVFIALVAPSNSPKIFGILRVFRLLRSLRPLRVINRAPGLKLVVETLLSSLRPIGNIVLISGIFFLIFGILGVQLFKGTFWHCHGPPILLKTVRTRSDCEALRSQGIAGIYWTNRKYNFDNVGQALMALFVLSSKDGWVNIMYNGLDAVGVDLQPVENHNQWMLLYFISFLLLVGFFVLNMFVGVVVENFHRCRKEQEAEERARRAVKRAERLEKRRQKLRGPPYYASYSKFRLYQHNVVTSKYFDLAIALVIGLNVVTMAMEYYMMPPGLMYALKIFNYFFTAVFFFEAFFKLVALGIKRYISDRWNQLDVAIVILSVVGIILEEMENDLIPINPTIIRVMRVLRIARILKLLKMARGIRALLDTVFQALPQVTNLGTLFFLLFFIFSTLGVELFGRLECDDLHPCEGLGEHAHFRNFGMAFLTLFRVATGDNWNGIMKDALREDCRSDDACITNCCVSPIIAPIYFVIFVLLAQFTLVNVVVAVLMRHLQESNQIMRDDVLLDEEIEREIHLEHLRQLDQSELENENLRNLNVDQETETETQLPIFITSSADEQYGSDLPKPTSRKCTQGPLAPFSQPAGAISLPNLTVTNDFSHLAHETDRQSLSSEKL